MQYNFSSGLWRFVALFGIMFAAPCAFGQSTAIGPAHFRGLGPDDAVSGGAFSSAAGNHRYVVVIRSTSAPDAFAWQKDGGPFSAPVGITGAAQSLDDGVTIAWRSTTGHRAGDQWAIYATVRGSLAAATFVQNGVGSLIARDAESKLRDTVSVLDFAGVDATGKSDSTRGIQNALTYACEAGRSVLFPSGTYHVSSTLSFNCNVNSVQPETTPGSAALIGEGVGRSIIRMTAEGTDLLVASSVGGSQHYPAYVIRDLSLQGPDASECPLRGGKGGSGPGGGGLVVKGANVPFLYIGNVSSIGFCAPGSSGIYIDNVEEFQIDHIVTNLNDTGVTLADVAGPDNGSVANSVLTSQNRSNGWRVDHLGSLTVNGSVVQSNYGNGIYATDMDNAVWSGTHLENNNYRSGSLVNTSSAGNTVIWVSGEPFSSLSAGDEVNIQGRVFTVRAVISGTSLTLTSSPGNQTGVDLINPQTGSHGLFCSGCFNNHFNVIGNFSAWDDYYLTARSTHNRFTGGDRNGFQAGALIDIASPDSTGNIWEGYIPSWFRKDPRQTECLFNSSFGKGMVDVTCPVGVFQTLSAGQLELANDAAKISWPGGVFIGADGTSHDLVMGAGQKQAIDIDRKSNSVTVGNPGQTTPLIVVDGSGSCEYNKAAGGYSCSADRRFETNIVPLGSALPQVMKLTPRRYRLPNTATAAPVPGLVAQEVQAVIPEAVHTQRDGSLGISYQDLVPYLIRAIQEQQAEIDALKKSGR